MRIRTIKPEFWSNEKMARMPDFTRLLALGLLNYADDHGYFWANPLMVRGSLFPFEEDSSRIRRGLAELECEGFVELGKTADDREWGRVVKFSTHQKVDRPQESKIKHLALVDDKSSNDRRTIVDQSSLYRIGDQGSGIRGREGATDREIARIPAELKTPEFEAAWKRWMDWWSDTWNSGRPNWITFDAHLMLCVKYGADSAVQAISNSISKKLRQPDMPFERNGGSPVKPDKVRIPPNVARIIAEAARVTPA